MKNLVCLVVLVARGSHLHSGYSSESSACSRAPMCARAPLNRGTLRGCPLAVRTVRASCRTVYEAYEQGPGETAAAWSQTWRRIGFKRWVGRADDAIILSYFFLIFPFS
jgi:hypothetical protein